MVDVRVDHTLIEQTLATLSRYVYVGDLRLSQRSPIEELQRIVRSATVERTVTDASVMVCSSCGTRRDECPECGDTSTENPTHVDAAALAEARSAPTNYQAVLCDTPDAERPAVGCRCDLCQEASSVRFVRRADQRASRRERNALMCRTCMWLASDVGALGVHVMGHNDVCGLCAWDSPNARNGARMIAHRSAHHSQCPSCHIWMRNDLAMEQHNNLSHRAYPTPPPGSFSILDDLLTTRADSAFDYAEDDDIAVDPA